MLLRGFFNANKFVPTNQLLRTFNNNSKKGASGVLLFGSPAGSSNNKKRDNRPQNKKPVQSFVEFKDQSTSNSADFSSNTNTEQGQKQFNTESGFNNGFGANKTTKKFSRPVQDTNKEDPTKVRVLFGASQQQQQE